ncbi:TetR family transcriptional regulator [Microbacterium sp. X-17]|uniref:TetR family transcriptional regulator n=1 Tax=Microbacterium sp. X-17 TaxID=3144404 RepID=UPI0031F4AF24
MTNAVRERSREILRAQLATAASDFCAEHGFDDVTVDEIAQSIGVSRATFFRYFGSKEDAVVSALRDEHDSLADRVRVQAEPGQVALDAVRRALEPTVATSRANPVRLRGRIAMIVANPSLRARLAVDRADQRATLASALEPFVHDRQTALAVAITASGAIELGWSLWAADPALDLGDAYDTAFRLVDGAAAVRLDITGFDSRDQ